MEYPIFWIDTYSNGYRKGCTHAVHNGKTLCGIDINSREFDGGYQTTYDVNVECKKCRKAVGN